jgi:hypothetical protein
MIHYRNLSAYSSLLLVELVNGSASQKDGFWCIKRLQDKFNYLAEISLSVAYPVHSFGLT